MHTPVIVLLADGLRTDTLRHALDGGSLPAMAALRNDAQMAHLEGDDARLQPGLAFDLSEHPREDFNDRWRSIALTHTGRQHSSLEEEAWASDSSTSYAMQASAIRWTAEWKAPLCAKPRIDGPQIATVVGR